jgi:protein-disulfide isomerase
MLKALLVILVVATAPPAAPQPGRDVPVATAADYVLGSTEAPVTVIEYASLTCPHCAKFHTGTLPQVEAEWIKPGRARLIYRDFPLDNLAFVAAMMARCAPREQYFELLADVFAHQSEWLAASDRAAALALIGQQHGLSDDEIRGCWKNSDIANRVAESRLFSQAQVDATPTFFINGTKFVGDEGYAAFDEALRAAEAKQP